ncbi:MAG: alpha-L-fucosidase, partial [Chloroflexia bacterium]|nr:alpha-L-fucosidase [Chloroflexia bacterium]
IIESHQLSKGAKIKVLGTNKNLKWENLENGFMVEIPAYLNKQIKNKHVWVFKATGIQNKNQE